jgi:hypothetical protein
MDAAHEIGRVEVGRTGACSRDRISLMHSTAIGRVEVGRTGACSRDRISLVHSTAKVTDFKR